MNTILELMKYRNIVYISDVRNESVTTKLSLLSDYPRNLDEHAIDYFLNYDSNEIVRQHAKNLFPNFQIKPRQKVNVSDEGLWLSYRSTMIDLGCECHDTYTDLKLCLTLDNIPYTTFKLGYCRAALSRTDIDGGLKVELIETEKAQRNNGFASRMLDVLIKAAERVDIPLLLIVAAQDSSTDPKRLKAFYISKGFTESATEYGKLYYNF